MREIDKPLRKSVRKQQFPNEEQLSEQFLIYKNRRSGYVSELTKLIKKIKTSLENKDYSKLGDYDNRLENIITKVRRVTTKLIDLVSKDLKKSDEILEFCTKQELRVVEIRKNILPHCSEKQSEILPEKYLIETSNLSQKELFTQIKSPPRFSSHQSERSIFSEKRVEKSYCSDSHCSKSSKSFCSTSHSSKSDKGKATSSHSSKPSEKKASALSKCSYSATGSSNASYLSVSECRKSAEHAKLAARQAEERAQRQLKLLEQSFELERQKIKEEVLVARENATLVEHQHFLNERLPKEVKVRSRSESPNGLDENLIHKWVNNSSPQCSLIGSDSVVSESSNISSQLSGSNTSVSEFPANNLPSRTHNERIEYTSQRQCNKIKKPVKYPPTNNSMNLNVAEVKSYNHHPLPQKDPSNINDALHNLSLDVNRNSVKKKSDCTIDINSKILDKYIH